MSELYNFFKLQQRNHHFLLLCLPARVIVEISYAAHRGVHKEEGAVQRLLNQSRIGNIRSFTLQGGDFPSAIILNWVGEPLIKIANKVKVPNIAQSAQLIDGQHRVAGISAAMQIDQSVGDIPLPVAIYEALSTRECANIFLSINTEQKPVPRSLVFDLYGLASETLSDPAAVRARDIATFLDDEPQSPYHGLVKFPGTPRMKGGIALSTAVTAIKPLVEEGGIFSQINFTELEIQRRVFMNFFTALQKKYGNDWFLPTNAFMYASGFVGAVDFLKTNLITYCIMKKSFSVEEIFAAINIEDLGLIRQEEVKGLGGKDAPRKIHERLISAFATNNATRNDIAF